MNVGQINYHDVANGPGIRVAIFVTGFRTGTLVAHSLSLTMQKSLIL